MTSTTMNRIILALDSARLSANMFSAVAGIPQASLSAAMNGRFYLGSDEEMRLHVISLRCAEVIESLRPLTLARGDWQTLKKIVDSKLSAEEIREHINIVLAQL